MLLPHLRPLWRDRTSLQLGTDPARAVILEFDDPATARLLDLLDGGRTESAVLGEADALGVPAGQARATLALLRQAGVVVDAHTLFPNGWPEAVRRPVGIRADATPSIKGRSSYCP